MNEKFELERFDKDINDIKASLKSVSESLQRLARLEERFASVSDAITNVQRHVESLDERIRKLENEHIYAKASAQTLAVTGKVAWALGGGVVMAIFSKLMQLAV